MENSIVTATVAPEEEIKLQFTLFEVDNQNKQTLYSM